MASAAYRSNKFYFFIVGYTMIFGMLAFFGTMEATRRHAEQDHVAQEKADQVAGVIGNKALFYMPRMDLTMAAVQGQSRHVRLGISLEMDKKNMDRFGDFQPRVSDRIITFLDHENIEQFKGADGMFRLRHDILFEVNKASPIVVSDIIFREFVVR